MFFGVNVKSAMSISNISPDLSIYSLLRNRQKAKFPLLMNTPMMMRIVLMPQSYIFFIQQTKGFLRKSEKTRKKFWGFL